MSLSSVLETVTKRATHADPLGATLKFDLGDDGNIYLDGTGDNNIVSESKEDADCVIQITKDNFENLLSGSLNPMAAFMGGKIKVKGDMGIAMKLQSIIS
ncbi:MAG: SCP2 sterol-binding domain-containing protein [Bacteroidota bacterium]